MVNRIFFLLLSAALGGAGYVEESVMPRLYREAPVNAIWEGSGNVICLDVLRAHQVADESLSGLTTGLSGEIRIGLMPTMTRSSLAPALTRFMAEHPNVDVRRYREDLYRTCLPIGQPGRAWCALVRTDAATPEAREDVDRRPRYVAASSTRCRS